MIQVLHNPRCGKSRNCLAFLDNSQKEYEIINYLTQPLIAVEIETLLKKLNLNPIDIVRQKEAIWIEHYKGKSLSDQEIITAIVQHPILLERPIVIDGDRAIIGRELDKLSDFI
ncbi:arsenate reductase [Flavobacterium silvisoli]|uniref:Arsenate reductase n=1 Tax=Flavobacterium silvisoli TaxID=2529433 RepID=A0A4Q9YTU6_9FLAO|nr:ArsC/Spx/MgsR family protein [Flavobacterium silvisoli]TBX67055.1 arsenate reductase [Flavobacterium silvisoli]